MTLQTPAEDTPEPENPPNRLGKPADPVGTGEGVNPGQKEPPQQAMPVDTPPLDDMLRPSARRSDVVGAVKARVSFVGQTHIGSVVINEARQNYRVPLTDLATLYKGMPFVSPPGYDTLSSALTKNRVLVCLGPDGCGKEMAVTHALLKNNAQTVRLLPTGLTVSEMSRVIQAGAEDTDAFVLPGLDEASLRSMAGPTGQPIRAAVSTGQIIVAVVTAAEPNTAAQRTFEVIRLSYPDPSSVLECYGKHRGFSPAACDLAGRVLEQLTPPLSPATIAAITDEVASQPARPPAEIAALFNGAVSSDALRLWLGEGRPPGEVAILAAGVTMSGAPSLVVQERAHELARLLCPPETPGPPSLLLGGTSWPSGLLRTATEKVNTHFGVQPVEIVEVADPHRPATMVQAIWQTLGADFRSCYCDWLTGLPEAPQLRWHAAYTAGVLFITDPVLIEERVLRPWARSEQPELRRCAGLALGAPLAAGADPTPSRALAHAWATSGSPNLRAAAVAAYGGLLGAWDPASAAPLKLFRIGQAMPALRREADMAIAGLTVAGPEASAARSGVLAYLKLSLADRPTRARVYGCLPLLTEALCWPRPVCAESLAALRAEPGSWGTFTGLLAAAMISPAGINDGQQCLFVLVRGVARGVIEHGVAEDVIRGMKHSQIGLGTIPRLGSAIRRTLAVLSRSSDDAIKDVAAALSKQFYR